MSELEQLGVRTGTFQMLELKQSGVRTKTSYMSETEKSGVRTRMIVCQNCDFSYVRTWTRYMSVRWHNLDMEGVRASTVRSQNKEK